MIITICRNVLSQSELTQLSLYWVSISSANVMPNNCRHFVLIFMPVFTNNKKVIRLGWGKCLRI